jgi:hypothetical protein
MKFWVAAALTKLHILQIADRHVSSVVWKELIIFFDNHSLKWFLYINSIADNDLSKVKDTLHVIGYQLLYCPTNAYEL